MTSSDALARTLTQVEGLALVSIRVPSKDTGGKWVVNKRYGESAWQYGRPFDTLEDAMKVAFPAPPTTLDDLF